MAVVVDVELGAGRGIYKGIRRYLTKNQEYWDFIFRFECKNTEDEFRTKELFKRADVLILGTLDSRVIEMVPKRLHRNTVITYPHYKRSLNCKIVSTEDTEIGRIAARYFVQQGFENFVFIPDDFGLNRESEASRMRLQGYREVIADYGCKLLFPHNDIKLNNYNELLALLKEFFDKEESFALFLNHDQLSMKFQESPITQPILLSQHVGILGVNNDTLICESANPPLSSIDPDYFKVGYQAAETINNLFHNRGEIDDIQYIPPSGLVERASSSILQVDDKHVIEAVNYINKNACRGCQVKDLLTHLSTNRQNLLYKFQKHLKMTPQEMILEVKMKAAKKLLLNTDFTVQHIAQSLSYVAEKSLRKTFTQHTGMTPGEFRKANRDSR